MILSIFIYTIVSCLLFFFGWHYNQRVSQYELKPSTKQFLLSWEIIASLSLFTVVTALRYHTGWDHEYYIQDYVMYQNEGTLFRDDFEIGFRFIESAFASLGFHYSVFFGFIGFINIFFIYIALRRNTEILPWVGLFIMLGPYFLHLVNSIRQGVVECVFVSAVLLVTNKKYIWYFIVAFAMTLIHTVAYLIIPLYFVIKYPFKINKTRTLFLIYFGCFILGQFPILLSWTINIFSDCLTLFGYHKYVDLFNSNPLYSFHRSPIGVVTITLLIIHIFLIFYYTAIRTYFKENKFLAVCYNFAFIYACYFVLVMNTAFYFKRPCELILPFFVISSGYLTDFLYKKHKIKQFIAFGLLNCIITITTLIKVYINGQADSPNYYHFIPF